MDIALELVDHFVLDYAYSAVFPAHPAAFKVAGMNVTTAQTLSSWEYKPTSFLFYLEPSVYAYSSSIPRDNVFRQAFSLFLITW